MHSEQGLAALGSALGSTHNVQSYCGSKLNGHVHWQLPPLQLHVPSSPQGSASVAFGSHSVHSDPFQPKSHAQGVALLLPRHVPCGPQLGLHNSEHAFEEFELLPGGPNKYAGSHVQRFVSGSTIPWPLHVVELHNGGRNPGAHVHEAFPVVLLYMHRPYGLLHGFWSLGSGHVALQVGPTILDILHMHPHWFASFSSSVKVANAVSVG